ncbi:hypothetical protein BT96DRAFT_929811 [Gymnopus androsaceus JB14]|uniref:Uncharacterized protein n=1 Tax=Gymnopus androsaceus JB14 TaxID=1447944 RepID=A0A6A4GD21_9AGAR|nr:hypothetical protein BT96DRAFT_929811 [Gymnopus androsaceus JB14]
MHIILRKENNGSAHKGLIALLLAGFAMMVLSICLTIAASLFLVNFGLVMSLPGGLIAQIMAANLKAAVMENSLDWSGAFLYLIADTAIVWRAWALWVEYKLIKRTLLIILLADIGVQIADAIVDTKAVTLYNNNTVTLDWLSTALNFTINVVATLLIAHRAWTHHQSTHTVFRNKKTQVETVLLLMVESGAIFGMIQLSVIIIQALDLHSASISPIVVFLESLYLCSAALNPVALLILIHTGNTYEHSFHLEDGTSLEINSLPNFS